jgi:chorismate-pyruvate lyase
MLDQGIGVLERAQRLERQDVAQVRIDRGVDPLGRLLQQERESERRTEAARQLEEEAVLALEADGQDGRLVVDDQPPGSWPA